MAGNSLPQCLMPHPRNPELRCAQHRLIVTVLNLRLGDLSLMTCAPLEVVGSVAVLSPVFVLFAPFAPFASSSQMRRTPAAADRAGGPPRHWPAHNAQAGGSRPGSPGKPAAALPCLTRARPGRSCPATAAGPSAADLRWASADRCTGRRSIRDDAPATGASASRPTATDRRRVAREPAPPAPRVHPDWR